MDELCGTKPWIEPISSASSNSNNQPTELLEPARRNKGIYTFNLNRETGRLIKNGATYIIIYMYFFIHKIKIKRICIFFARVSSECVQFLCYK